MEKRIRKILAGNALARGVPFTVSPRVRLAALLRSSARIASTQAFTCEHDLMQQCTKKAGLQLQESSLILILKNDKIRLPWRPRPHDN